MRLILASISLLAAASLSVAAQPEDRQVAHGRQVFERQCAPCHGAGPGDDRSEMLPGTAALAEKYEGARPAALHLRDDLPAPVLQLFVRRGAGAMPPFRPSELSDTDIAAIAAYIAADTD
ncbi:c-type cytochrome [Aurantiacibacter hainanensis]|uniref:c-type cytochrome n=1 Tax=Aurantiacibacter hainanensis TaxID=3076114 RepID=UPI0030C774DF